MFEGGDQWSYCPTYVTLVYTTHNGWKLPLYSQRAEAIYLRGMTAKEIKEATGIVNGQSGESLLER